MTGQFEVAHGSVAGRAHLRDGKGNQDAAYWRATEDLLVAAVCDGCSAGAHSEVGAQIGARLIVEAVHAGAAGPAPAGSPEEHAAWLAATLEQARRGALDRLRDLQAGMGGPPALVVRDFFLFTVVGLLVDRTACVVFALGDGLVALNGEVLRLGPFPANAPPYLGYGLLEGADGADLRFTVVRSLPSEDVRSALIGTDGLADLIDAAGRPFPGSTEVVGGLEGFWRDDRVYRHPDHLRRRLARANRATPGEPGLLPDDTTVLVLRRRD